ncbi:bacillithiol system redox-active protein YtxJ [Peribacillus glennii]|uniref:Bacillithiol system redox-active protein YtxJ n=1 Tax=Peribacillus glennii TaxID=2303991 RepID=A0A372LIS3_9BACI|nr:bacillithiol system redox-active protein YtxJ [Peribacillus glennii]RFU66250.1 bacillithiol system redox-active protein YtxJ [Peribacillus glennii]
MAANKIETKEQFEELANKDSFLLIKHSLTCPISGAAFEEYESFLEDHGAVKTAYLAVQEARELSNHVAETYGIKHESPQAILFKNGQPVWNASHWKITADSLSKAVKE